MEQPDFAGLRALYINCTLKRSPEPSHTQLLMDRSIELMRSWNVQVESIRAIDHDIATGVWPDMTEHGWAADEWPAIYDKVLGADILVLGSPIWLGEKSSVCTRVIERLYGNSSLLNESGQYSYYGRAGGCLITGNEDGTQALLHEHPLRTTTSGVFYTAAGGRGLGRRGRPRPLVR